MKWFLISLLLPKLCMAFPIQTYGVIPTDSPYIKNLGDAHPGQTFTVPQKDVDGIVKFALIRKQPNLIGPGEVWLIQPVPCEDDCKGSGGILRNTSPGTGTAVNNGGGGEGSSLSGGSGNDSRQNGNIGRGSSGHDESHSPMGPGKNPDGSGDNSPIGNALKAGGRAAVQGAIASGLSVVIGGSIIRGPLEEYQAAVLDEQNAEFVFNQTVLSGQIGFESSIKAVNGNLKDLPSATSIPDLNLPDNRHVAPPTTDSGVQIDKPVCLQGSIIRTDNSSLGESVPIVGTGFNLVYFSHRVPGRLDDQTINLPLIGASATGLSRVDVQIDAGGSTFKKSFPAQPNLSYGYRAPVLNGDNQINDTLVATISITYVKTDGSKSNKVQQITIGHWQSVHEGLGGWTISVVHKYDVKRELLLLGNGMSRHVKAMNYKGRLLITNESGSEAYLFDLNGNHLKTLNTLTGRTIYSFVYDSSGQIVSVTDAYQNTSSIQRSHGLPDAIVSPYNQVTRFSIDSFGWLASIANPAGETYQMTYSPLGLLQTFEKPNHHISRMNYDASGLLQKDAGMAGDFTELIRSKTESGQNISATSALGRQKNITLIYTTMNPTQTIRDARGLQTTIVDQNEGISWQAEPTGLTKQFVRSNSSRFGNMSPISTQAAMYVPQSHLKLAGNVDESATLTDPNDPLSLSTLETRSTINGRTSFTQYNALQRSLVVKSPEGRTHITYFDDLGKVIQAQSGDLAPIRYSYDHRGRLIGYSQDARSTSYQYDSHGNIQAQTDALNNTNYFAYDAAGRVVKRTLPDGSTILFQYDGAGDLVQLVTPRKHTHQFATNSLESISSYFAPANSTTSYEYNLDHQLTAIHLPSGTKIDYDYDPRSGVLLSTRSNDAAVDYSYSPQSGLISVLKSSDGITTQLDYVGPLVNSERVSGEISGQIQYGYDSNFRLALLSVNSSSFVHYRYDRDNLVTSAGTEVLQRSPSTGLITGSRIGVINEARGFDKLGALAYDQFYVGQKVIYSSSILRDRMGRITAVQQSLADGISHRWDYRYDRAGRLNVVYKDSSIVSQYGYDANGNRLNDGATFDSQDRLIATGTAHYSYDTNGALASKNTVAGVYSYSYDSFGNLKAVTTPTQKIEYLVDGQNRRVAKKVNGHLVQGFLYQSHLQIAAELDSTGSLKKQFVYAAKPNVPDYMIMYGRKYAIISDHLGSPRMVVDVENGDIKQEMDYDEFGRVLRDTNPGFTPFGFAGGLYDQDTKLVRFGARDYDPEIGRWTTKDPLLFGGGDSNLYGYVANDPVNSLDPLGLWSISAGFYAGLGGGASFGVNPDGGFFATIRGGIGLGGGLSFDPNGTSPSYLSSSNPGRSIGAYNEASAHVGPFELGANANSGYSESGGAYAGHSINGGLTPSIGFGAGVSAGFECSFGGAGR